MTGLIIAAAALLAMTAFVLGGAALFTRAAARKVSAAFPPRGRFITTSAGRIHVLDQGSGPPVVLLHGLGGQIGNFSYGVTAPLAERFRVIAIDRAGAGYSDPMRRDVRGVRRHAAVVCEVMEALALGPAVVAGHSLGGAVALALAIDRPDLVKGLALIAPLTQVQDRPPAPFRGLEIRFEWQRRLMAYTLALPLAIRRQKATFDALFGPEAAPSDLGTRGLGLLSVRPQSFISASTDLMHANDDLPHLIDRYAEITAPTRVLFARHDRILDPEKHGRKLVLAVPRSRLDLMDGGHMIPITAAGAVAAFVAGVADSVFGGSTHLAEGPRST